VSLEDYEPVAVRLNRLLTQIRDAGQTPTVITQLLSAPGTDVCVMRAELWIDGVLRATGHAEEVRGQGNVNRTSHLENAETSAVGRMCENYAPTTDWKKRPSREEMSKVERVSNKPQWKQREDARTMERDAVSITNKMPGKCTRCGLGVNTGEGLAVKANGGSWQTFHRDGECPPEEEPF
jgi:hypothetical protein